MALDNQPALDAEKTGSDQLVNKYRTPPGMEDIGSRSTLLVGTRGSGKTMFLRKLHKNSSPQAFRADLRHILNPISADTGMAGGSLEEVLPSIEMASQTKTTLLLALWFASECIRHDFKYSTKLLRRITPSSIRRNLPTEDADLLDSLYDACNDTDFSEFNTRPPINVFHEYIAHTIDAIAIDKPFYLLLDRADDIPYFCLPIILSLLDQSHSMMQTIVATRPGNIWLEQQLTFTMPSAGDHFNVRYLGENPYSQEWRKFQMEVLSSWIPKATNAMPPDKIDLILGLSRDSMRCALELVYQSIDTTSGDLSYNHDKFLLCHNRLKESLLNAAQGTLRAYNSDLRGLLRRIRKSFKDNFSLPIAVNLVTGKQTRLFNAGRPLKSMTKEERLVLLGLKCGLFTPTEGTGWHPNAPIDMVEIQPLFMWEDGDRWLTT